MPFCLRNPGPCSATHLERPVQVHRGCRCWGRQGWRSLQLQHRTPVSQIFHPQPQSQPKMWKSGWRCLPLRGPRAHTAPAAPTTLLWRIRSHASAVHCCDAAVQQHSRLPMAKCRQWLTPLRAGTDLAQAGLPRLHLPRTAGGQHGSPRMLAHTLHGGSGTVGCCLGRAGNHCRCSATMSRLQVCAGAAFSLRTAHMWLSLRQRAHVKSRV